MPQSLDVNPSKLRELLTPKHAANRAPGKRDDIIDHFLREIFGEDLNIDYIDQDQQDDPNGNKVSYPPFSPGYVTFLGGFCPPRISDC